MNESKAREFLTDCGFSPLPGSIRIAQWAFAEGVRSVTSKSGCPTMTATDKYAATPWPLPAKVQPYQEELLNHLETGKPWQAAGRSNSESLYSAATKPLSPSESEALAIAATIKAYAPADEFWIPHYGGECPVRDGTLIRAMFRDGDLTCKIDDPQTYRWSHKDATGDFIAYTVINQNPWIKWSGGVRPVPDGAHIEFKMQNGESSETRIPGAMRWNHHGTDGDIVAYRRLEA